MSDTEPNGFPTTIAHAASGATARPIDGPADSPCLDSRFQALDIGIEALWSDILKNSRLVKAIRSGAVTRELYAIYLMETYHYTLHNARNQALVALRDTGSPVYSKFCFEHAADESGHELMALHDLRSLGFDLQAFETTAPLPATETLIAYLYWVASHGNSRRRLGYSYWAESCYEHINPLLSRLSRTLGLSASQMTFFVAHSTIDAEHAADVRRVMERTCGPQDWQPINEVAFTSLSLTGAMLDAVYDEYVHFVEGASDRYAFLRERQSPSPEAVS